MKTFKSLDLNEYDNLGLGLHFNVVNEVGDDGNREIYVCPSNFTEKRLIEKNNYEKSIKKSELKQIMVQKIKKVLTDLFIKNFSDSKIEEYIQKNPKTPLKVSFQETNGIETSISGYIFDSKEELISAIDDINY